MTVPVKKLKLNEKYGNLYFKVADGVDNFTDIMDYYLTGYSMPMGRLSFEYRF